jgi:hypothetical protein
MNKKVAYVWKSTIVSKGDIQKFQVHLLSAFSVVGEFIEEYKTTSGRGDAIFYIYPETACEIFKEKIDQYGITTLAEAIANEPEEYTSPHLKDYIS